MSVELADSVSHSSGRNWRISKAVWWSLAMRSSICGLCLFWWKSSTEMTSAGSAAAARRKKQGEPAAVGLQTGCEDQGTGSDSTESIKRCAAVEAANDNATMSARIC